MIKKRVKSLQNRWFYTIVSFGYFEYYIIPFKNKVQGKIFALSRETYQEVLDQALIHPGTFLERLTFFAVTFTGCIENSGLKLCQEWVRNTVDPGLIENEDDRGKPCDPFRSIFG